MLVVVPYLVRHPGTTLAEASALFDVPLPQLRRDLELLFLSGLPPYGPGDLIMVDIDEDGGVWISMAEHFARPLRLTREEALAVYVRATELAATPGFPGAPALTAALAKLRDALGSETLGDATGIAASEAGSAPEHLETIRDAAEASAGVRIGYTSAGGERSVRTIEPEAVFATAGHWYAVAWDVDIDDERLFRIDRMTSVARTGTTFTPRGLQGAGRPLFTPGGRDVEARLRLAPGARWVAEYYVTTDPQEEADGSLTVTFPTEHAVWLARLLLRLGPDVTVIEPASLAETVRQQAEAALALYRT
jgi:proteasome accessory factor C